MSGRVNIPSYIQDLSYRYKMPKMVLKQESRLNGVKTNIFNLDEVAKALRVPEEAIIKFFCAELGASSEKTTILKGQHNFETLQKSLDKFIEKYLLCTKCKYPETSMYLDKKSLKSKCRACGTINNLDSNHRSGKQLMKQLPKNMSEIDSSNTAAQANETKSKKKKDEDDEEEKDEELKKQKAENELLEEGINLESEEVAEAISKISEIVKQGISNEQLQDEAQKTAVSFGLSNEFRYYILMCGIFTPDRNIVKNWAQFEPIFLNLISQDGKIGIKHLMQAIVQLFVNRYPDMMKYSATFMKLMYDQEVFEEEFIIKWHGKKLKLDKTCALYDRKAERAFRKGINSFVDWLIKAQEEEEEEDGEEEDEEEEEVKTNGQAKAKVEEESEAVRKQKELIQKQMQDQQKMIEAKKEEALNRALTETQEKVNVLDINVEDDFEIDDI